MTAGTFDTQERSAARQIQGSCSRRSGSKSGPVGEKHSGHTRNYHQDARERLCRHFTISHNSLVDKPLLHQLRPGQGPIEFVAPLDARLAWQPWPGLAQFHRPCPPLAPQPVHLLEGLTLGLERIEPAAILQQGPEAAPPHYSQLCHESRSSCARWVAVAGPSQPGARTWPFVRPPITHESRFGIGSQVALCMSEPSRSVRLSLGQFARNRFVSR